MIGLGIMTMMGNFDADTKLWLAQCGTRPSNAVVSAVDTFIRQCKVDGNWSLLDRFWLFAQDVQANARISIVNPSSTNITEVNSPTFNANQGYTGNGTTSYLRSAFIPSSNGINYTLNSASLFLYSRTNNAENKINMGGSSFGSLGNIYVIPRFSDDKFYGRINESSANFISVANTDGRGLFVARRTASNATALYKNGVSVATDTDTSNSLCNVELYILGYNNNGSLLSPATKQIAIAGVGSGSIEQAKFYTAVQNLATAIGFSV